MAGLRDLALFVCCALVLTTAAACGGGSPSSGKGPDANKVATATLPAKLPDAKILGNSAAQPGGGSTYTVKDGDTLAGIASRFGVSLEDLRAANPSIDASKISVGQVLKLPVSPDAATAASPTPAAPPPTEIAPTLAPATEPPPTQAPPATSTPAPISDTPAPAATAPPSSGGTYVVQQGDFPAKIAEKLGITLEALLAANPGLNSTDLHIGQVLNLPPR